MIKSNLLLSVLLICSFSSIAAESIRLESGNNRNTLIELYTSEGCSSCPPAEEYLNKLKNDKNLWKKWVPIALHVQYWDYIGWKDHYATKENGLRQSRYANIKRAKTVYTPAFMVNGANWRRGIFSSSLPDESSLAGNLIVTLKGKSIKASYHSRKKSSLKLNVAVLGMDLTSTIERGENEGRTAKHEFVVVGFDDLESNDLKWDMKLPKLHYKDAKKYALAIWVSEGNNPTPIQAVGGLLPNYKP